MRRGHGSVEVFAEVRDVPVIAYVSGSVWPAEPGVGIFSAHFEPEELEVEADEEDAGGLFPLSPGEETDLMRQAAEKWEPE